MKKYLILAIAALSGLLMITAPALAGTMIIRSSSHPVMIRNHCGPGPRAYTDYRHRPPYRTYRRHPVIRDDVHPRRHYRHGRPYPSHYAYPVPVTRYGSGVFISVGTHFGW